MLRSSPSNLYFFSSKPPKPKNHRAWPQSTSHKASRIWPPKLLLWLPCLGSFSNMAKAKCTHPALDLGPMHDFPSLWTYSLQASDRNTNRKTCCLRVWHSSTRFYKTELWNKETKDSAIHIYPHHCHPLRSKSVGWAESTTEWSATENRTITSHCAKTLSLFYSKLNRYLLLNGSPTKGLTIDPPHTIKHSFFPEPPDNARPNQAHPIPCPLHPVIYTMWD